MWTADYNKCNFILKLCMEKIQLTHAVPTGCRQPRRLYGLPDKTTKNYAKAAG
jgi:hypothetical protein